MDFQDGPKKKCRPPFLSLFDIKHFNVSLIKVYEYTTREIPPTIFEKS